jgi:hypothetical protein
MMQAIKGSIQPFNSGFSPTYGTISFDRTLAFLGQFTIRPNVLYIKVSSRANSSIGGTDGTSR